MAYNGPHEFVDVPALGRTVKRGEPVDIENISLAKALLRQGWAFVREQKNKEGDK